MRNGDLKKSRITKNCSAQFAQVSQSALDILHNRDNDELHEMADTIDWLLFEPPTDETEEIPELPDTTARQLYTLLNDYNVNDSNYKLHEYFAVLALLYISEETMFDMFLDDEQINNIEGLTTEIYYWSSGARLSQASGAIAYAEMMLNYEKNINDIAQKKISLKAKKSAIKRHADANSIKSEFINYYQNNTNSISRNEMARRFYEQLDDEKARKLTPSNDINNAVRTLTTALRDALKV